MDSREKRALREQKRQIKRLGNQRLRRQVRQALTEAPEEVADLEPDYGKFRSVGLNGMDQDTTRRRSVAEQEKRDASGTGRPPDAEKFL